MSAADSNSSASETSHGEASDPGLTRDDRTIAVQLLLELAEQLHRFGTPSHQLEGTLTGLGVMLGLDVSLFVVPTMIEVAVGRNAEQQSLMLRVEPGAPDLARLESLLLIIDDLRLRRCGPREALDRVRRAASGRRLQRIELVALALAGAAAAGATVFGGGTREVIASSVICCAAGMIWRGLGDHPSRAPLAEFLAGAFVAFAAAFAGVYFAPISASIVILASLIIFLPGLQLATSMNELAMRHLVSGTARLMGALMTLVALGFGVAIGDRIAELLPAHGDSAPVSLPQWTVIPAVAIAAVSLAILYRARTRDIGWVLLGTSLGIAGAAMGERMMGAALGVWVGAALVGLAGNTVARLRPKPAALLILPGITFLLPGSVAFRGIHSLMQNDVISGIGVATTALTITGSLVAGLLLANALVPSPRGL